ncbi:MAG: acetate/propionate family kinase [Chloroflexi bacterium]|nr:acetate/propionate family kinase [Chloroflexota bacterium]
MRILVLNAGSSSLKTSLVTEGSREADTTSADWPAADSATDPDGLVTSVVARASAPPDAVGYRVVHGSDRLRRPVQVTNEVVAVIEDLDPLAPLHNRRAAALMRAGRRALPDVPHVACFDTAFHETLPEEAWRYPLPAAWVDRWKLRRYGFHGLSVAWSARRSAELLGRAPESIRLVVAHLGSGSSVTAVDGGRSVDTSMGFTPLDGLMMGTRAGAIDPGILLHLLRNGERPATLADGLAHHSGLAALAGTPSLREIEQRSADGDAQAALVIAMYARRAAAAIGAASTALPSLDALVFTGGVGEHSARVRDEILARLSNLGAPTSASTGGPDRVAAIGPPAVLVVAAREDLVIADAVAPFLG